MCRPRRSSEMRPKSAGPTRIGASPRPVRQFESRAGALRRARGNQVKRRWPTDTNDRRREWWRAAGREKGRPHCEMGPTQKYAEQPRLAKRLKTVIHRTDPQLAVEMSGHVAANLDGWPSAAGGGGDAGRAEETL